MMCVNWLKSCIVVFAAMLKLEKKKLEKKKIRKGKTILRVVNGLFDFLFQELKEIML